MEIEKAKAHILIEIIEYVQNSVVSKSILKKTTGSVNLVAIDTGAALAEKNSPFDTYIQIIEGNAEVIIDDQLKLLKTGESLVIPAHTSSNVKAQERFKMIMTIIKSGYESITL